MEKDWVNTFGWFVGGILLCLLVLVYFAFRDMPQREAAQKAAADTERDAIELLNAAEQCAATGASAQALAGYRDVIERYPGTHAAGVAEDRKREMETKARPRR